MFSLTYKVDVTETDWIDYLRQGYNDLDSILTSTRPIGQQFYQGNHVWNRRMLKEEDVLNELQNNSIFTTVCGYLEDIVNSHSAREEDVKMGELLDWYSSVCKRCAIEDEDRIVQLLHDVIFYASYRFNGSTDNHPATMTTERNDRVLNCFNRLSSTQPLAKRLYEENQMGPIVIITPELGKWSTVGGLGVMVDNLSKALAHQGQRVLVISPYYDSNRYGERE